MLTQGAAMALPSLPRSRDRPFWAASAENTPEKVSTGVNPFREAVLDERYPGIRKGEYVMAGTEEEKKEEE